MRSYLWVVVPLNRWLRMCSKMAAKLRNSSDESSMGSAVYFSRSVLTENLRAEDNRSILIHTLKGQGRSLCFCKGCKCKITDSTTVCTNSTTVSTTELQYVLQYSATAAAVTSKVFSMGPSNHTDVTPIVLAVHCVPTQCTP